MTNRSSDPSAKPAGKEDSPAGDARVDGADAEESGYRRDDYWREEANDKTAPGEVPEPEQGYAFESPEERARAGDEDEPSDDADSSADAPDDDTPTGGTPSGDAPEASDEVGKDDARIVED